MFWISPYNTGNLFKSIQTSLNRQDEVLSKLMNKQTSLKDQVKDFWEDGSCGEVYATGETDLEYFETHRKTRYTLEPYLPLFAKFEEGTGKDVLEVGVGMGADHVEWAKSKPNSLTGVDLTSRAVEHTKKRLSVYGFHSKVVVGDAENLPFDIDCFDMVYAWGVLHHSPDTGKAISEVHRVLRKGGTARIMIHHKYAMIGYMLWARYGLLKGKPFTSLDTIYARHLESPGTKAFSLKEARQLCKDFSDVHVKSELSFGDLLYGEVGQRHKGLLLSMVKKMWPRSLIRILFKNHGLALLIIARK